MALCKGWNKSKNCACAYKAKEGIEWCGRHLPKEDCSICLEAVTSRTETKTACGHVYHKKCLSKWLETKYTCPCCRTELKEKRISAQEHHRLLIIALFAHL